MRIVVAMSGGVDSSVAAALLAEAGHEVIGLSMQLYDQRGGDGRFGSCCTIDDLHDARRAAGTLGIPHYIVNFERQFETHVISNFVQQYLAGRTPIPCVHCNGDLKFTHLLDRARALGTERVATGHYARVERDPDNGRFLLKRGRDPQKDQSYFLFSLDQSQLACAHFPIGSLDKQLVRSYARARGLSVADKPDSQEICFALPGTHSTFVEQHAPTPPEPGVIRDTQGRALGRHAGVHRFTVGQRKGLGLVTGVPLYVLDIDAAHDTLTVGPREALERTELAASNVTWISGVPPAGQARVTAQIRHRHHEAPAAVWATEASGAVVRFDSPQTAVAPGQAVVFYQGDVLLGGGWID